MAHHIKVAYLIYRLIQPSEVRSYVGSRLLKRRRRVQVIVLERIEIEYARDDLKDVLPECLVERKGLLARDGVSRDDEFEATDFGARILRSTTVRGCYGWSRPHSYSDEKCKTADEHK